MKVYKIGTYLCLSILLINCATEKALKTEKINKDGIEILYGEISIDQLFYDFPEWKSLFDSYRVKHSVLDSLKNLSTNMLEIDVFLGTWCGDSKREVPRFLKIISETNLIPLDKIRLFAVDRNKKLENGLAIQNDILRVATIIFKRNSKEIGRIVEFPEKSLESDIVKIISSN
jgi:thiol-disulfide isomerase/thioredoxin